MVCSNSASPGWLRISGVVEESIVDGNGLRYVVFVQGCPHDCPGCHNQETHDFDGGELRSVSELFSELKENTLLSGLTLSGGEPFAQAAACAELAEAVHAHGKNVWTYSGYTLEQLLAAARSDADVARLLRATDVLVDGPYLEAQRDLTLSFRGSSNQRVIKLAEIDLP